MDKVHRLVYVHYNMRLKVRNLMNSRNDEDYCSPIDLNVVFENDDILGEWIRERESPLLPPDDVDHLIEPDLARSDLKKSGYTSAEIATAHPDFASQSRSSQVRGKKKQSHDDDDDNDDDNDDDDDDDDDGGGGGGDNELGDDAGLAGGGGNGGGNYGSQSLGGMTAFMGDENYDATQDSDHGCREGIDAQRRYLAQLTGYPSSDDCGHLPHPQRQRYRGIHDHMQSLGLGNEPHRHSVSTYGGHQYGGYGFDTHRHSVSGTESHGSGYGYGSGYRGYHHHHVSSGESEIGPTRPMRSSSTSTGRRRDRSIGTISTIHGTQYGYGEGCPDTSSNEFRGFGYYHQGGQPSGFSGQSSQPTGSTHDEFSYPYHYFFGN